MDKAEMVNFLLERSRKIVQMQPTSFVRDFYDEVDWTDRLIGIRGARGTGKTTVMLQRIKQHYGLGGGAIYVTMDDLYFSDHRLVDVAESFVQMGGKALFLDEVHKYTGWSRELKNIYDFFPELNVVFSGSSIVNMDRQDGDLSRRSVQYLMPGLSFREYLKLSGVMSLEAIKLDELLQNHTDLSLEISQQIKPLLHFNDYLQHGYYPYFLENKSTYHMRLGQVVRTTVESDLQFVEGVSVHNMRKILHLMRIISENVPFKPNTTKLAERTELHRNTLVGYLHHLEKARLLNLLGAPGKSMTTMQKPEKIYLENTNLMFALAFENHDVGTQRETFFLNQLRNAKHEVGISKTADFEVDGKWTFEVGGQGKDPKQVKGDPSAYRALDQIESGSLRRIPLWLFGLLY